MALVRARGTTGRAARAPWGPAAEEPVLLRDAEREPVELGALPAVPRAQGRPAPALAVVGLGVRYGTRWAVRDVDLHVARREVVALLGHNGCGKSSTLRAIFGLVAGSGQVLLGGEDVTWAGVAGRRGVVGFVPADGEVFADLTVRENLLLGAPRHVPDPVRAERLAEVLDLFGELAPPLSARVAHLSGGQRRMVGLGIALMARPSVLLLDEPTRHLAPALVGRVLRAVRDLADRADLAVLMAEVNVAAALAVADRAYVMDRGGLRAEHSAAELRAAGPAAWWRMF